MIADQRWRLAVCAAAALYWELVLIRWLGSCVRIVAYYSNFVLIAAFFGMGTGALLASHRRQGRAFVPVAATFAVLLGTVLSGFQQPNPNDPGEMMWLGSPVGVLLERSPELSQWIVLPLVYLSATGVMLLFGQWVASLFRELPPLRAYSIEIAGSIVGILAFAAQSAIALPPTAWFGFGFVLLLLIAERTRFAQLLLWISAVAAIAGTWPFATAFSWSPYYRIHLQPLQEVERVDGRVERFARPVGHALTVNSDFHQMMLDLALRPGDHEFLREWRTLYDAPYRDIAEVPEGPILIIGAGSGNDVAAALRNTSRDVVAVDIDPTIVELGRKLHPERPYQNPRVRVVNADARTFLQRTDTRFAMVVFGYLDSHATLSAFASVRLDNFVYTAEALHRVREVLIPGGKLALTFATLEPWMHARFKALARGAFGNVRSVVNQQPDRFVYGAVYEAWKRPAAVPRPGGVAADVPTDDWPYLYLRARHVPEHYRSFLLLVLVAGALPLLLLPHGQRRLRMPYFLLGAAFFLLETVNVVSLALLYGSTWYVNVLVFSGVLVWILLGNWVVASTTRLRLPLVFAALAASLGCAYAVPTEALLSIELGALRGAVAVLVFLGPVFFAAIVFATLIKDEPRLDQAYGSNVLGAVVGGATEYLSMVIGFKALLLVAAILYACVALSIGKRTPRTHVKV